MPIRRFQPISRIFMQRRDARINGASSPFLLHGTVGCAGLLVALLILFSSVTAAPEKITIYFYSAETNINNFKSLKMEFDGYLAQFGNYEFQPFSDRKTFEEHVRDKAQSLLLVSSWHYANIYQDYGLAPLLVGVRNGQMSQKRILVSLQKANPADIAGAGQIASASSVPHTTSILSGMFHEEEATASFKILTVPKDLDALMSVGFGMAKSALITENSFESLKTINPSLHKKLNIIAESEETLLLIIAAPENFVSDARELLSILQTMPTDPNGEKRVRMLGLDDWQPIEPSNRSKLEG